jgi:hypothetical protein
MSKQRAELTASATVSWRALDLSPELEEELREAVVSGADSPRTDVRRPRRSTELRLGFSGTSNHRAPPGW